MFTLIEPQIEMKPYLDKLCSDVKAARWLLAGAGAAKGVLPFTSLPGNLDGSGFRYTEEYANDRGLKRQPVTVITLDSVCEESQRPIPEIVKIDAEGFDLEVMKGCQRMIGVTELFFLEVPLLDFWFPDQSFHTMVEFMRERGYEPYDITEVGRRPYDGALGFLEMAFAKKSGLLRAEPTRW
jgi:FkbM family methyltransferase